MPSSAADRSFVYSIILYLFAASTSTNSQITQKHKIHKDYILVASQSKKKTAAMVDRGFLFIFGGTP